MASQWLYRHANRVHGPVTLRDLEAAVLLGFVWPDDLVSRHQRHCWKPLLEHAELRELCKAADARPQSNANPRTTTEPD
jgi:hypothetical protein